MELDQQITNEKKHVGYIMAIVALGVLLLGAIGYIVFEKTIWSKECETAQDENGEVSDESSETSGVERIDVAAFEADKKLFPDGVITGDVSVINSRYPLYERISSIAWLLGRAAMVDNPGEHNGVELFELGDPGDGAFPAYIFDAWGLFPLSNGGSVNANVADNAVKGVFGVNNLRSMLTAKGAWSYENGMYVMSGGIGGDLFPVAFLTGITKSDDKIVLDYNYARAIESADGYEYKITNQLKFTLSGVTGQILTARAVDGGSS